MERIPADSDDAATEAPALVPDAAFEVDPRRAAQRAEMTTAAFPGLSFNCNANR